MVGGLFYFNYPGGTGLCCGAVFGRIAGEFRRRLRQGEVSDGMAQSNAIGFIGLGVMGEPICRNLLKRAAGRSLPSISQLNRCSG